MVELKTKSLFLIYFFLLFFIMNTTRCSRKTFEWIAVLFIFVICIFDFVSIIVAKNCPRVPPEAYELISGTYEFYYRQIFHQMGWSLVSLFVIAYSYLIKACPLTWIAVALFALYENATLVYSIFPFDYGVYLDGLFYMCIVGVSSILTLLVLQKCGWKR